MSHDPFDLRGQERAKQEIEARNKVERQIEQQDLKWLMKCRQGRRIVWRLLERTGLYRTSFDPNPAMMAFNEGNRNLGLMLMAQLNEVCPERYTLMVQEQRDGRANSSAGDGTS